MRASQADLGTAEWDPSTLQEGQSSPVFWMFGFFWFQRHLWILYRTSRNCLIHFEFYSDGRNSKLPLFLRGKESNIMSIYSANRRHQSNESCKGLKGKNIILQHFLSLLCLSWKVFAYFAETALILFSRLAVPHTYIPLHHQVSSAEYTSFPPTSPQTPFSHFFEFSLSPGITISSLKRMNTCFVFFSPLK